MFREFDLGTWHIERKRGKERERRDNRQQPRIYMMFLLFILDRCYRWRLQVDSREAASLPGQAVGPVGRTTAGQDCFVVNFSVFPFRRHNATSNRPSRNRRRRRPGGRRKCTVRLLETASREECAGWWKLRLTMRNSTGFRSSETKPRVVRRLISCIH